MRSTSRHAFPGEVSTEPVGGGEGPVVESASRAEAVADGEKVRLDLRDDSRVRECCALFSAVPREGRTPRVSVPSVEPEVREQVELAPVCCRRGERVERHHAQTRSLEPLPFEVRAGVEVELGFACVADWIRWPRVSRSPQRSHHWQRAPRRKIAVSDDALSNPRVRAVSHWDRPVHRNSSAAVLAVRFRRNCSKPTSPTAPLGAAGSRVEP